MYPKWELENLQYRYNILKRVKDDKQAQEILMAHCANDALYFFNTFLRTYDPRLTDPIIPFITYPFQDKYIKAIIECVENDQDNITEKSRDMWFSWMILWILLWWFLFKWWSSLIGSYKEDYVDEQGNMDSSFERLRYMISNLPKWMIPQLDIKYMSISNQAARC